MKELLTALTQLLPKSHENSFARSSKAFTIPTLTKEAGKHLDEFTAILGVFAHIDAIVDH